MAVNKNFYLGKKYDLSQGKALDEQVFYDPAHLTTHAIIVGMTGSGKTGLGIGLLEEAALHQVPAIIIDPKGDLGNLLLHFPDFEPEKFEPWVDPEAARRAGKSVTELAAETAGKWKNGLADYGLGRENLLELDAAVDYVIYTPGSTVGVPVNILASFQAPQDWEINKEVLREKITTTVTALLALVGLTDIDPLRSREHILLSNLLEHAWSKGESLDLNELIMRTQKPPFERLGAFPVNSFFPEKDRFELAMLLNNFLASPSFQTWLEGQTLDIGAILYTPEGKPRHSIFYISHLNDSEKMFFITLLLAAVDAWMRTQRGTSALRAMLYFDEIYGYLPPIANPPSRPVLLRMLKQARAFGVGLVLATQNPVDVDYKALSNCGTWMIGRLQTDQDKQRLLDGLESAAGSIDRAGMDKMISAQQKRVFLLHNVNSSGPQLFQTRWTMNYLAGPLTRVQLPLLKKTPAVPAVTAQAAVPAAAVPMSAAAATPVTAAPAAVRTPDAGGTLTRPAVPAGVSEFFIPNDLGMSQALAAARVPSDARVESKGFFYRPALLAQAEVRYLALKYKMEHTQKFTALVDDPKGGLVRWDNFAWRSYDPDSLSHEGLPQARYATLPVWLSTAKSVTPYEKDFVDYVFRSGAIRVRVNEALKVYAGPTETAADFKERCSQAARTAMQAEIAKVEKTFAAKTTALQTKLKRQQMEVDQQEDEVRQRGLEELSTGADLVLGLLGGRKRKISSSLTKRRMTAQAKEELNQEKRELEDLATAVKQLESEKAAAVKEVQERWAEVVNNETEIPLSPQKKDIFMEVFGVAWCPYYQLTVNGKEMEIPAYDADGV